MLRATALVRRAAVKTERIADTVTLDHEARTLRRRALTGENGLKVMVELDREMVLNDGDALTLDDGRLLGVRAAPQRLLEVRAENPLRLLSAAYGIGSRHAAAEITANALYVEDDPALAELVRGQGCTASPVMRPFQPGAIAHDCGHDHGHHGHAHGHHGHDHHRNHDDDGHDHAGPHEHHGHDGHDHDGRHEHHGHDYPGHDHPVHGNQDHGDEHHGHGRDHGHAHEHGHSRHDAGKRGA